ncbi:hypothetical protein TNCV_3519721 [Trichonephila clavipes]|uniref:Uncharacterized protein n=1 Tax=Trichonephila clavipes TaxID=2585209 RepID=A0A8X6VGD4_TRICX|nr:hypothetical protein TNCV_3519721 [Trichonephila clavipes]
MTGEESDVCVKIDACVRTCQPDYIWSEKLKAFEHCRQEKRKKIEELKELLFGLETAKPTEEAEFERGDLYKNVKTRLDDLERKPQKDANALRRIDVPARVAKNILAPSVTAATDDRKNGLFPLPNFQ